MRTLTALIVLLGCVSCSSSPPHSPSVRAEWLPSNQWTNHQRAVTHGSVLVGAQLARDIAHAPQFPPGALSCSVSYDAAVLLTIPTGTTALNARVNFTGCGTVDLPGREPLSITDALRRDLRPITPPRWSPFVS